MRVHQLALVGFELLIDAAEKGSCSHLSMIRDNGAVERFVSAARERDGRAVRIRSRPFSSRGGCTKDSRSPRARCGKSARPARPRARRAFSLRCSRASRGRSCSFLHIEIADLIKRHAEDLTAALERERAAVAAQLRRGAVRAPRRAFPRGRALRDSAAPPRRTPRRCSPCSR